MLPNASMPLIPGSMMQELRLQELEKERREAKIAKVLFRCFKFILFVLI